MNKDNKQKPRYTEADCSTEKGQYGQWVVSAVIDGVRVHQQYFSHTREEALEKFLEQANSGLPFNG
jgi:hypothetical protein